MENCFFLHNNKFTQLNIKIIQKIVFFNVIVWWIISSQKFGCIFSSVQLQLTVISNGLQLLVTTVVDEQYSQKKKRIIKKISKMPHSVSYILLYIGFHWHRVAGKWLLSANMTSCNILRKSKWTKITRSTEMVLIFWQKQR